MNNPRPIIIDTDPGQDDAVAIMLALSAPDQLDVKAIVAVAGNVGLRQNVINALKVVELTGRTQIPVYAGCPKPMTRALVTAEHVHGQTGLDGPTLPDPTKKVETKHGVDAIIEIVSNSPEKVTICALGPLTNIATALNKAPEIKSNIAEIVIMGGGYFEGGNITPVAEFNIFVDPEAAEIVMKSALDITLITLDVTHKALATPERLEAIKGLGNACGRAVSEMLHFSERFDLHKYGWDGAPLHDPAVIAYLLDPKIYEGRFVNVEIETQSDLTRGMTVVDFWRVSDRDPNVNFISKVNDERFYALLTDSLAKLP